MEWLAILGLAAWAWWQNGQINELKHKMSVLEHRLAMPKPEATPAASQPQPTTSEEPLLLDTPVPEPSNDDGVAPPRSEPLPELLLTEVAPADPAPPLPEPLPELLLTEVAPLEQTPAPAIPAAATPQPRTAQRTRGLEQWLAETGFAWLGGSLLALGAIFLVTFAAQQAWFTAQIRLGCAVALGLGLIGASEWARRNGQANPPGHPLVASMLAGAGIVTFYTTVWAAHGLYQFIDWPIAALALAFCAAAMLGLSLLHGQPLAILAIALGLTAPAFASLAQWPSFALTLYVSAVGAAGFAVAALRRWAWTAAATMTGLYFWFAAAISFDDLRRALALASFTAVGGAALAFQKPLTDDAPAQLNWTRAHAYLPAIAISVSSALLIGAWLITAPAPSGAIAGPAWVSAMLVALAAAAVRTRVAPPATLAIAIAALVFGFAAYLRARFFVGPLGADFYPFALFSSIVVVISALGAKAHRTGRMMTAGAGAAGGAVLAALAAFSREQWHSIESWAPLFSTAAVLFAAAWHTARDVAEPRSDKAVALWTGAGAIMVLIGVESAFPASIRTVAHAGAALLFVSGLLWRGWDVLRWATLTATALTLAHALSPSLIGATLAGDIPILGGVIILITAAALLFGASYLADRTASRAIVGEALSAGAVVTLIIAAFLLLRWTAAGGAGSAIDSFTENSLRTLALAAAGHAVMTRQSQNLGIIGRWRGHVLLGAALFMALLGPALTTNPWWGLDPPQVTGPQPFDTLTLALLAPAAFAFAAAYRLYVRQRLAARIYAGAGGVFGTIWALLEIRRAFHGEALAAAPVGLFEGACYAIAFLFGALLVASTARMRGARDPNRPFTHDLITITDGVAWFSIVVATVILMVSRHPWWGAQETSNALSTLLAVMAHFVAVGLALWLGRALSREASIEPARFAAAGAAALFGWSTGHVLIRWLYHRGYMDDEAAFAGIEALLHAVWPLAFVLAAAWLTARAPNRDGARHYVYDLQAIWAAAAWPALGFTAFGLWISFNPWWGFAPASAPTPVWAIGGLTAYLAAAGLATASPRVPQLRWPVWFGRAATVVIVGHLLFAAIALVRWSYHRDAMASAAIGEVEMWIYSAVLAVFGAGCFWLGMRRNDPLLRWIGLGLLIIATLKVFFADMARLGGVVRVLSAVGLGIIVLGVAWAARRFAQRAPPPGPGDLLTITPSARREKRHGRRQRSS